jgi:probable rRNA maturation factor
VIDVEIEDEAWTAALPDAEALAVAAANAALSAAPNAPSVGCADSSPGGGGASAAEILHRGAGEVDRAQRGTEGPFGLVVLLTDDETVRDLNARFRSKDKPTNVLSFPAAANAEGHLGDIALAYGVCVREAAEQGKLLAHHLQHLVAHGVLHLLGYDHMSDDEAEAMEGLERVVLAGLGAPDPYQAGGRDHD